MSAEVQRAEGKHDKMLFACFNRKMFLVIKAGIQQSPDLQQNNRNNWMQ